MDREFIIDEEPQKVEGSLEEALVALLRQMWEMRQAVQELKLESQEEARRLADFLKQLLAVKERRCDQFVAGERGRRANENENVPDTELRTETEKWVHRLEVFQQSFDGALIKFGVTRYEPSGMALPERDDIKDTESGNGLAPGTIIRIIRPSYLWNGEVLRPAEVVVAE